MCEHCHEAKDTKKKKKYLIEYKELMEEYDWEANEELDPSKLTHGMSKEVWWICPLGHHWKTKIIKRTSENASCPYCSGHKVLTGFNDLASRFPKLMKEFDWEANKGIDPTKLTYGSGVEVWWVCKNGHKWKVAIDKRTSGNCNCPYCSNKRVLKGYNDLATLYPEIAKEWDYEANGDLKPTDVVAGAARKVHWVCALGHKWTTAIVHRTRVGTGCPHCFKTVSSLPEFAIKYYLEKLNQHVIQSYIDLGFELDLFLPDLNIGIEYDGFYWHKDKFEKDLEKNKKCNKFGITLYRIRENLCSLNDSSIDIYYNDKEESLSIPIKKLIDYIFPNNNLTINYKKDKKIIQEIKDKCLVDEDIIKPNSKIIVIHGVRHTYKGWGKYFGCCDDWVSDRVHKYGLKETIKYLTKLFEEKEKNGFCNIKHSGPKHIEIMGKIMWYKELSLYLGKNKDYVSNFVRYYGLEEATKRLTKMYLDKQNGKELKSHRKYMIINGKKLSYSEISRYLGHSRPWLSHLIQRKGLDVAREKIEILFNRINNGESIKKPKKTITIDNKTLTYSEWSIYFGYRTYWVCQRIRRNGLEATIEYLTELYWEKQKQESTQKDNNAG